MNKKFQTCNLKVLELWIQKLKYTRKACAALTRLPRSVPVLGDSALIFSASVFFGAVPSSYSRAMFCLQHASTSRNILEIK